MSTNMISGCQKIGYVKYCPILKKISLHIVFKSIVTPLVSLTCSHVLVNKDVHSMKGNMYGGK